MNPNERERIAVCRVLLDIEEGMDGYTTAADCPHFQQLQNKLLLTEQDFEKTHYNIKMLLALIVCDLYSEYMVIPLNYRMAFETLMNAIDWPISFSEVLAKSKTE